jgi:hypothetical protein
VALLPATVLPLIVATPLSFHDAAAVRPDCVVADDAVGDRQDATSEPIVVDPPPVSFVVTLLLMVLRRSVSESAL